MSQVHTTSNFATALAVETRKLRGSLALLLAAVAPSLIAIFVFFNQLRQTRALPWTIGLQTSAAIWAFFMLPMTATALTALVANAEHGPRSWDYLRALPRPRWHLYGAKALSTLTIIALMSVLLAMMAPLAIQAAGFIKPALAATGAPDFGAYLILLARIYLAAWLLMAVQLWIALRFSSFVPALAVGIGGTFFAVVATSSKIGVVLPWQTPVNQLASNPDRALLALAIGLIGGCFAFVLMSWRMDRREVLT